MDGAVNVLITGSGGREHALAWKLAQSRRIGKLYVAPGNPGCAACAENVDLDLANLPAVVRWAKQHDIGLVAPGAETALCDGIVDLCREAGIPAFGPDRAAAQLEGSKIFAKSLMRRHGIPTANFAHFEQYDPARRYLDSRDEGPVVVKADGLAAGKGVMVCRDLAEADAALRLCFEEEAFGLAGQRVVVEECLRGREVSLLALVDGHTIAPLAACQDHKAALDGDLGPNTGGMGAYSPVPFFTDDMMDLVISRILVPVVHAMNVEEKSFRGVLYAGLMLTGGGPKVLEFNVRFGDPETQPLLMRLDSDLLDLLEAVAHGKLGRQEILWKPEAAVCVVAASDGYPGTYEKGKPIEGLAAAGARPGAMVFHAGTKTDGRGTILTDGGRVLGVTALGSNLAAARIRAYKAMGDIRFDGMRFRTDIGLRGI